MSTEFGDVGTQIDGHVGVAELQRPPHNFFDQVLIGDLATACEHLQAEGCRVLVLAAQGKSFCAGAQFHADTGTVRSSSANREDTVTARLYAEAVRLFRIEIPIVAAVQGAAIGGGLGVASVADFRIACPEARFAANFVKLGIHPGFGLSHSLPLLIGQQRAALLLLSGRRINGETARDWGLVDELVAREQVREAALALAREIAANAPLAVASTRTTLRRGLADAIASSTVHELAEQTRLRQTEDHQEGVMAVSERREGRFKGR